MKTETDLVNMLKEKIKSLEEAKKICTNVLAYISGFEKRKSTSRRYERYFFYIFSKNKVSRPINSTLFVDTLKEFEAQFSKFRELLDHLTKHKQEIKLNPADKIIMKSIPYTIGISIGIGADIALEEQEAKKNVGERFKEFVASIFRELNISVSPERKYGSYVDIVLGSELPGIEPVLVSVKTTSKDRFKMIFKERDETSKLKYICIFLHDVQRKGNFGISKTFVPNVFLRYYNQSPLSGVYYMDPPPEINHRNFKGKIKMFYELLVKDIWSLLE